MRYAKPTGDLATTSPSSDSISPLPGEGFTRVFVTVDTSLVILLAFAFGFGNGWATARILGINPWIAPLIQPAVDLAVVGLMIGVRYLAIHGMTDAELAKPRRWLRLFGLLTLAMNTALPVQEGRVGRAAWDAIGPVLLIAWSELAPWLLRAIYSVRQQEARQTTPLAATAVDVVDDRPPADAPVPPNVVPIGSGHTLSLRELARHLMIQWDKEGKRYAEGVIGAVHAIVRDQGHDVTRRRVGQVCMAEWDDLYTQGSVRTPRTA